MKFAKSVRINVLINSTFLYTCCFWHFFPLNLWFFPKKWTRNLETVVNRFSKAVKFLFLDLLKHYSPDIYILKANNKVNTRKKKFMFKMIKTDTRTKSRSSALIVNFEHTLYFFFSVSIVDFEHIFVNWDWTRNMVTCVVICGSPLTGSCEPKNRKIIFHNPVLRFICIISRVAITFHSFEFNEYLDTGSSKNLQILWKPAKMCLY